MADTAGPDALQKLARYERTLMNNQQPCVSSRSCRMAAWSRLPTRSDVKARTAASDPALVQEDLAQSIVERIPGHHRQAHRSMKRGGLRRGPLQISILMQIPRRDLYPNTDSRAWIVVSCQTNCVRKLR